MSTGLSEYARGFMLQFLVGGSVTPPASFELALSWTPWDLDGSGGSEPTGDGYARQPIAFQVGAFDGQVAQLDVATFPDPAAQWGPDGTFIQALGVFADTGELWGAIDYTPPDEFQHPPVPGNTITVAGITFTLGAPEADDQFEVGQPIDDPPILHQDDTWPDDEIHALLMQYAFGVDDVELPLLYLAMITGVSTEVSSSLYDRVLLSDPDLWGLPYQDGPWTMLDLASPMFIDRKVGATGLLPEARPEVWNDGTVGAGHRLSNIGLGGSFTTIQHRTQWYIPGGKLALRIRSGPVPEGGFGG